MDEGRFSTAIPHGAVSSPSDQLQTSTGRRAFNVKWTGDFGFREFSCHFVEFCS